MRTRGAARNAGVALLAATFAPLPAGAVAGGPHPAAGRLPDVVRRLVALDARGGDVRRADGPLVAVDGHDRVLVDINVNGHAADAARELRAAGLDVTAATDRAPVPLVEGWLPVDRAGEIAALGVVQTVDAVGRPERDVVTEGDAAHRGPQARAITPGVSGAGVVVGVVSDSINQVGGGVAASQASGDLPPVVVVADGAAGDADEGRAMAEIIYDQAPGIGRIEFASGDGGAATKAARINVLASHGVSIIADDIPYLSEPFFQDGVVSQAVDAARAQGVVYLASAGNRRQQSWEGRFTSSTTPAPFGFYNDFGGGDTEQTIVTLAPNARITVNLQWAEPWGAAVTDLDAVLIDDTTGLEAVASTADQTHDTSSDIGHNPSLLLTWKNTTAAAVPVGLRIWHQSGTPLTTPYIKWMARRDPSNGFAITEHATNSPTINPDAAAATGGLAVGAIPYFAGLDTPEAFSSYGPLVRRFGPNGAVLGGPESRAKPELAAADGVATSVPGFAPFFGTSASAASAAGVAALVKSARPWLTADGLAAILTSPANTQPCSVLLACGSGFVFADRAVGGLDRTPPVVTGRLTPSPPDGKQRWYRTAPVVRWSVTDPDSVATGCPSTTITVEGSFSVVCTASSVGGSATASLQGKRDGQPPRRPTVRGLSRTYYLPRLPKPKLISCRAIDLVSGIASCKVTGVSTKLGTHTATARAVDHAGNVVTRTVRYAIVQRRAPR